MLVTPPFGASSNTAPLEGNIQPPVELVVGELVNPSHPDSMIQGGSDFV